MSEPVHSFADSVTIESSPDAVYAVVSDVTRTGEWSPVTKWCRWDDGDGPRAGAWFTGHNETPQRTWETRSRVDVAEPGREFAWLVGGGVARWSYVLETVPEGTRLTESWAFLPEGIERFHALYTDEADEQIADRVRAAHDGIPATLAAIKGIVEDTDRS